MTHRQSLLLKSSLALTTALIAAGAAQAQATGKPDGVMRAAFGLGAAHASGNSRTTTLTMNLDAVRATDNDKWSLYGGAQYAKSAGTTTAEQFKLGTRYDRNINSVFFGFGGLDFERNKFANLKLRSQLSGGVGYHVIKNDATTFDVFGGLAYSADKYIAATTIDGALRTSYNYPSLMLGEESTHKLTATTSFKQRLTVIPNLKDSGQFRANWDTGLAVAMSKAMNLTVGFGVAHNSDPGTGRKKTDTLLTTGIAVKFD